MYTINQDQSAKTIKFEDPVTGDKFSIIDPEFKYTQDVDNAFQLLVQTRALMV